MGSSYRQSVTSLPAQTFTSCKASLFVYIGLLGEHDLLLHLLAYALFVGLQRYLHFRKFLISHVTVVGYAVMVYCVAGACKSKTTYTGRPGSLAGPRQRIKP